MKARRRSVTTLYTLVHFVPDTGDAGDPKTDGRRIAAAIDAEVPTGTEIDDLAVAAEAVERLVGDLLVKFPKADVYRWGEHDDGDLGVTLTVDDSELELVVEPLFVEVTMWSKAGTQPKVSVADLQRVAEAAAASGLHAIFDPQSDRLVDLPDDGPAIIAALAALERSAHTTGEADAERVAVSESNEAAARALGGGEEPRGFFSRLLRRT